MKRSEFEQQCDELGIKIANLLSEYPQEISICTVIGVVAGASVFFNISRDKLITMIDSVIFALNDKELKR